MRDSRAHLATILSGLVLAVLATNVAAQDMSSGPVSDPITMITCPADPREEKASYVGPYKGPDNVLTGTDLARDAICADRFKVAKHPKGFVGVFGSSRISEYFEQPKPPGSTFALTRPLAMLEEQQAFNVTYAALRTFAHDWTQRYPLYPILTGAGPGLMEAASRGAADAGTSIGYTTYYAKAPTCNPNCYTDDPKFWQYTDQKTGKKTRITTEGLVFSSVSMRETAMILHSAAIVIAPGGTGTEWETFQILEMLKSKQLHPVPIFFVGQQYHWNSLMNRLRDMEARGTIKKDEIRIEFAQCPADLINRLAFGLKLAEEAPPPADVACAKSGEYELNARMELGL